MPRGGSPLRGLVVGPMYFPAAVGKVSKDKYCSRRSRRHITVLRQQMQLFHGANGNDDEVVPLIKQRNRLSLECRVSSDIVVVNVGVTTMAVGGQYM